MKKYGKLQWIFKLNIWFTSISLIFFTTPIEGNTPNVLEDQNNDKTSNLYYPFLQIEDSQLHYVFDSEGDRVISVNFNKYGSLVSKTAYGSKEKKHRFIFNDVCEREECQQFMHP